MARFASLSPLCDKQWKRKRETDTSSDSSSSEDYWTTTRGNLLDLTESRARATPPGLAETSGGRIPLLGQSNLLAFREKVFDWRECGFSLDRSCRKLENILMKEGKEGYSSKDRSSNLFKAGCACSYSELLKEGASILNTCKMIG